MICVEGNLRTGSYQDKNHSDVTHYTTVVIVDNAEFCGSKSDNQTQPTAQKLVESAKAKGIETSVSDLSDFEEILGGDPPF